MDHPKKSNKISDIVRLQQILKKWRKAANAPKNISSSSNNNSSSSSSNASKSIKFLKRTLSFTDLSSSAAASSNDAVPKGYLAVCVGKELKRYIIPTEYLGHQAFGILLREAEEEFGFQQEGVLKIPCEVPVFEKILKVVEEKKDVYLLHELGPVNAESTAKEMIGCYSQSPDCELTPSHHPQMCR
ncbi:hypothetical protein POPTR_010G253800v4 [Populus trichocarpa]|jgi:SAUR family protein|uniref:SAUR family protein n=1 Tax=Populus trichocarpa TaxID=3694 RepID=B9HV11_POPTR|nr:protein SMALL AUXIN UP-REGULATED RNA 9 [Populus trichocarpa]KAI5575685.1 hypothetical protein BDE02_10G228100 [Populus trichocarpa]PNT18667.1 hypothetical protein POPTR_010G253800v4 [Populus trichocarpa]|eukprot:XP_002316430.1 auxin-responsive protein SAUR72 [Populus trichocarpa]